MHVQDHLAFMKEAHQNSSEKEHVKRVHKKS